MSRRSPIIYWLLLAATISVDAVATAWIFDNEFDPMTLYIALAFGQLSSLCAWAVLLHTRVGLRWPVPFVAGFPIAFVMSWARSQYEVDTLFSFTGLMWVHVAIILSLLWLLRPTRIFADLSGRSNQRPWQFAVRHLLVLMTCLAILIVVLQRGEVLVDATVAVVSLMIGNAILLIAIIAATQARWPWPLRLAASLGAAIIIAGICEWTQAAFADEISSFAFNIIQAIVIWSWIEVIGPRRSAEVANADKPQPLEAVQ
jgi:hypothetical protein